MILGRGMKTIIYKVCLALFLSGLLVPMEAQNTQSTRAAQSTQTPVQNSIYSGTVPVKILRLRQEDDSVRIILDFDFSRLSIGTQRSFTFTPVLIGSAPQNRIYKLRSIIVNGRQRHKAFMRETALNGWEQQIIDANYAVITINDSTRNFQYRQSVGFERWMRDARMDIVTDLCDCGSEPQQYASEKVANRIILEGAKVYSVLPNVAYIRPAVEAVKARSQSNDVFLDFPSAQTNINPTFGNNPRELRKIETIIKEIQGDKNVQVTGVVITGYASPEGDENFNNELSRGRAQALRNLLASRSGINPNLYRVGFGGEDWDGLLKALQRSRIEPKQQIISIVRYYKSTERKERLKALGGGRVWERMLNDPQLFPKLRRVESKINYTVKSFDVNEAKEVIKTRPQQLSMNEMFLVANTYKEGSKEFEGVFETMVRVYPTDPVANLNAGAAALLKNDLTAAERYLQKAQRTTPAYFNNMGVLNLLQNNLARAKGFFQRALEINPNLEVAKKNLDEVQKKQEADLQLTN
jgi:outer membrane protein OmpA-like peptidoglycan-associated protein